MPNPEAGNSSRRPFLAALAGLILAPLFGRADAIARPLADGADPEPDPSARDSFVGQITLITTDWIPRAISNVTGASTGSPTTRSCSASSARNSAATVGGRSACRRFARPAVFAT